VKLKHSKPGSGVSGIGTDRETFTGSQKFWMMGYVSLHVNSQIGNRSCLPAASLDDLTDSERVDEQGFIKEPVVSLHRESGEWSCSL
jgi:hypothetical protein